MTECVCGICPPCRRELRLAARTVAKPVTLSPLARQILAEPVGYEPVKPRVRPVQNRRANTIATRRRADNAPNLTSAKSEPTPTPCAQCGELRGITKRGGGDYGHYLLAGAGDLCEVCAERPKHQATIDSYLKAPDGEKTRTGRAARRAKRYLARELRNGRAYSPTTPEHGNTTGYDSYGCRCEKCATWKADDNARRRAAA